jgi:hypothetical protein
MLVAFDDFDYKRNREMYATKMMTINDFSLYLLFRGP